MFAVKTVAARTTTRAASTSSSSASPSTKTTSRSSFLRKSVSSFLSATLFLTSSSRSFTAAASSSSSSSGSEFSIMGDSRYPGTAEERLQTCRNRAKSLTESELSQDWDSMVRPKLLWAAGLKDLKNVAPGKGYTGHCFNDFNHVDATTMILDNADNEHDGSVRGIAVGNQLGDGIRVASLPDAGPGGTWCTCSLGANQEPPHDVAHVQFQSRIAWKLVWVPGENGDFSRFVLVDDDGTSLTTGVPTGNVPNIVEREHNFQMLRGGRYAECAKDYESPVDGGNFDGFSAR